MYPALLTSNASVGTKRFQFRGGEFAASESRYQRT